MIPSVLTSSIKARSFEPISCARGISTPTAASKRTSSTVSLASFESKTFRPSCEPERQCHALSQRCHKRLEFFDPDRDGGGRFLERPPGGGFLLAERCGGSGNPNSLGSTLNPALVRQCAEIRSARRPSCSTHSAEIFSASARKALRQLSRIAPRRHGVVIVRRWRATLRWSAAAGG